MAGGSGEDLPPELVMCVFRAVHEYIAGADEGEAESVGHQLTGALGLGMAEVAAGLQRLREQGWTSVGGHVIVGPHTTVGAKIVLAADTITLAEDATVLPLEGIGALANSASRSSIGELGNLQVLTLVLVWLLAAGMPIVQQALPLDAATIIANEYGTAGLAVAITSVILSRRRH
jgi:hypothetical protein